MGRKRTVKRGTRSEIALRQARLLHLRATTGANNGRIASELGISSRQVQRGFSDLRGTRPATRCERSFAHLEGLRKRYAAIHRKARALRATVREHCDPLSRAVEAVDALRDDIVRSLVQLEKTQRTEPLTLASAADLSEKGPNDVTRRLERALLIGEAPPALQLELTTMLALFGPQEMIPDTSSRLARDIRMTLLYRATDLTRDEVGVAFGCSYKTVTRVASKTVASHPEVGRWAEEIKQALEDNERTYAALEITCAVEGFTAADIKRLLDLTNRRAETLTLLGALPNPERCDYLAMRALLLEGAGLACERHGVGEECRDRVLLIIEAWADRKPLPPGLAPLPPRHKKLGKVSPHDGCEFGHDDAWDGPQWR